MKTGTGVLIGFVGLLFGGVGGFTLTNIFFKQKYEQKAEEEIASVRAAFANSKPIVKKEPVSPNNATQANVQKVTAQASNYVTEDKINDLVNSLKSGRKVEGPRMIRADEFQEKMDDGYSTLELTMWADEVITSQTDKTKRIPDADIAELAGSAWKTALIEETEEEVFIRNDKYKVDIAINYDNRKWNTKSLS